MSPLTIAEACANYSREEFSSRTLVLEQCLGSRGITLETQRNPPLVTGSSAPLQSDNIPEESIQLLESLGLEADAETDPIDHGPVPGAAAHALNALLWHVEETEAFQRLIAHFKICRIRCNTRPDPKANPFVFNIAEQVMTVYQRDIAWEDDGISRREVGLAFGDLAWQLLPSQLNQNFLDLGTGTETPAAVSEFATIFSFLTLNKSGFDAVVASGVFHLAAAKEDVVKTCIHYIETSQSFLPN